MSDARQTQVDCAVEQTAGGDNTGQLVAAIVVRVPQRYAAADDDPGSGRALSAGRRQLIQVDESKPLQFVLQTCDLKGLLRVRAPLPADMLAAMKAGKKLAVIFQNLQKENITVPLPLENFAEAFQKIQ